MIRNLAALTSITIVFSASFALSIQPVEAKTSRHRYYLVPPPPPYTPTMVSSAPGMTNALLEKPNNPYKYVFTRDTGGMRVVQPNPAVSSNPVVEARIQNRIDHFDSKISSIQKEIWKLLKL